MCCCSCSLVGLLLPFSCLFIATRSAVITVSPERQQVCEFSSTQLNCYTNTTDSNDTSPAVDRVQWTFNRTIVHGVGNRSLAGDFHVGPSVNERGYKLLIVNASFNDSGRYECAVVVAGNFTETAVAFINVVACDNLESGQDDMTSGPNHVPVSADRKDKPGELNGCSNDCIKGILIGVLVFVSLAIAPVFFTVSGAVKKLKSRRGSRFRRLSDYNGSQQRLDNEQL